MADVSIRETAVSSLEPVNSLPPTWQLYSGAQRWVFLLVLFLISTSNNVDRLIISVLLQPIKEEFKVSDTALGLLSGFSFVAFYATLGIPVARWADRGNRRFIITGALFIWSVMTALCGMARSFWQLALLRVGVGAGEAGAVAPGQSLLIDYFPPTQRTRALALFMGASFLGYVIAFVLGSHLADYYGWRVAFLALGLPGLLLSGIAFLFLKEPRTLPGRAPTSGPGESLAETWRVLRHKTSYVYVLIAMVCYFYFAYGAFTFLPSFMVRSLGVKLAEVGSVYGAVSVLSGCLGVVGGGFLVDRLARRDPRWLAWGPALMLLTCFPFYEAMLVVHSFRLFIVLSFFGGLGMAAGAPPMFAVIHAVCGSARRAMAIAVTYFFATLLGLGLGPVVTGAVSDWFHRNGSAEGLRYAMMFGVAFILPCAALLFASARTLARDRED